jgi:hypothetical protein
MRMFPLPLAWQAKTPLLRLCFGADGLHLLAALEQPDTPTRGMTRRSHFAQLASHPSPRPHAVA